MQYDDVLLTFIVVSHVKRGNILLATLASRQAIFTRQIREHTRHWRVVKRSPVCKWKTIMQCGNKLLGS